MDESSGDGQPVPAELVVGINPYRYVQVSYKKAPPGPLRPGGRMAALSPGGLRRPAELPR